MTQEVLPHLIDNQQAMSSEGTSGETSASASFSRKPAIKRRAEPSANADNDAEPNPKNLLWDDDHNERLYVESAFDHTFAMNETKALNVSSVQKNVEEAKVTNGIPSWPRMEPVWR